MTNDTGERERGAFLERWSRLKSQNGAEEDAGADVAREAAAGVEEEPDIPEDLKDFDAEALDAETADFSRFVKDDVPQDIQRMALRKLWESDGALANLDGLNDYDEDFTPAGVAVAAADFMRRAAEWLGQESAPPEPEEKANETPAHPETGDTARGDLTGGQKNITSGS